MKKPKIQVLLLTWGLLLAAATGIEAQPRELVDLTGRLDLTPEDIIRGLAPPRMRGVKPTLTPTERVVAITVLFDFASAKILPEAAQNLRSVGIALQSPELASVPIQIEGHTDSIGSDEYNQKLSERRARSVKQYLVRHHAIAPERLIAVGRGKTEPIADNNTPEGRQKNRRVHLVYKGSN
jgi:OOP family OmpA-OmpF porin